MTPGVAWGEKKTDLPTRSKWQIGLLLWLKALFGGCGNAAGGTTCPPRGSRGAPWRIFGDFLFEKKVTRGRRGGAPPHGEECRGRGASPSSRKAPASRGAAGIHCVLPAGSSLGRELKGDHSLFQHRLRCKQNPDLPRLVGQTPLHPDRKRLAQRRVRRQLDRCAVW